MFRRWNKFLAFLLAVAMVFTTFGSDISSVMAADGEYVEGDSTTPEEAEADSELWEKIPGEGTQEDATEAGDNEEGDNAEQAPAEDAEAVEDAAEDAATEEAATEASTDEASAEASTDVTEDAATESSSEDAAAESSSEDAAAESSSVEDAAAESSSAPVVKEKLVTVTYKATLGGQVSRSSETVDVNDKDAAFEGATASARNKYYQFVAWKDEDGDTVSSDATFVPADIEEDATFTAEFMKLSEMPAADFEGSVAGMNVTVHADEGIFPEGTTMSLSAISDAEAVDAAKDALGENVTEAKGVDITFRNEEGEEIEPADSKYVHVTITLINELEGENFSVVHKDDEGNVTKVAEAEADGAEFEANAFSVYIVVGEDEKEDKDKRAVCTYVFYDMDGNEFDSQRVKKGDRLADPGIPSITDPDVEFLGWYLKDEGGNFVGDKLHFGIIEEDVEPESTIKVYAKVRISYYLSYKGVDGEVARVDKMVVEGDEKPVFDLSTFRVRPKEDTQKFKGWSRTKNGELIEGQTLDVSTIPDKNDRVVYAVIVDAVWIYFDENDDTYVDGVKVESGGADYTGPIAVQIGESAKDYVPADPTRPGYKFDGWYTGKGAAAGEVTGELFDFTKIITEKKDIHLYAKWVPGDDTEYTVVIWQQQISDDKNAADKDKTYDFKTSFTSTGRTNAELTAEMAQAMFGKNGDKHFHFSKAEVVRYDVSGKVETVNKIRAKGDTVVNVYFDRDLMTIKFFKAGEKKDEWLPDGEFSGLYGQTLESNGYTWPSGDLYQITSSAYTDTAMNIEFIDNFIFDAYIDKNATDDTVVNVYKISQDGNMTLTIHFYKEQLDPADPWKEVHTVTYTVKAKNPAKAKAEYNYYCEDYFTGFTPSYYIDGKGQKHDLAVGTHLTGRYPDNLYLYFKRNTYEVQFKDNFEGTISNISGVDAKYAKVPYEAPMNNPENKSYLEDYSKLIPASDPVGNGILPDRTKQGYEFKYWSLDVAGTAEYTWNDTMPAANKVLYAHYAPIQHKVTLITDGGTYKGGNCKVENQEYYFNVEHAEMLDKDSLLNNISRGEDDEFVGWFLSADDNAAPYDYGAVIEDVTIYAKWRNAGVVNVVYLPGEHGSGVPTDEYKYATDSSVVVGAPIQTVDEDYAFIGWQVTKDGKAVSTIEPLYPNNSFKITSDIITKISVKDQKVYLTAVYDHIGGPGTSKEKTNIIYNSNDGKNNKTIVTRNDDNTDDLRINMSVIARSLEGAFGVGYERPGYRFLGWSKFAEEDILTEEIPEGKVWLNAGEVYTIAADNNPDKTTGLLENNLYAVWQKINIKVVVTISGHKGESVYDRTEHTTKGYDVDSIQYFINEKEVQGVTGYSEADFKLKDGCEASASRIDVGTADMNLKPESFENTSEVFTDVSFVVNDGSHTVKPLEVTVDITGNHDTKTYDGEWHEATGYVVEKISSDLYTEDDFTFTGEAVARRQVVGTTDMKLSKDQFANNPENADNFVVTFNVTDGYMTITPVDEVVVTITGNKHSDPYNGSEYTTSGYTVEISNDKYTEDDFTFSGTAEAKQTDVGTAYMNLKEQVGLFVNNNENFAKVTFVVAEDGYQDVTPIDVVVEIIGNHDSKEYDGKEHSATGYKVGDITVDGKVTDLYTEADFTFTGTAEAKRTEVGTTPMNLDASMFTNNSTQNFSKVTFNITDGYMEITPIEEVVVEITGNQFTDPYMGIEYTAEGYEFVASTPLYTLADFKYNGEAVAKRTNVGTTNMGLDASKFENTNTERFKKVTFKVVEDGWQEVTPIPVEIRIIGNHHTDEYDGEEHVVSGYTIDEISSPLYSEDDFEFTGTAEAKRTEVGTTFMFLNRQEDKFKNLNDNFYPVTFDIEDGYQEITPVKEVTVTIVGPISSVPYDSKLHEVNGYEFKSSNDLYKKEYAVFSGNDRAARTEVGKTEMGLKASDFKNINDNFETVTFVVERDGYQEITPIKAVVEIVGNNNSTDYDAKEHSVSGYKVKSISTDLYTESDFTFSGSAEAARTEVGKTDMGLKASQFANTNGNFDEVTFLVTDGYQEIKPITATVKIVGNFNVSEYDGKEHVVTGYEVESITPALYTEKDFTFSGSAEAKRTEVGQTDMGLTASQFTNTNTNFENVTFIIVDGYQKITPIGEVVVTITGHYSVDPYNGQPYTAKDYDFESSSSLYKEEYVKFSGKAEATRTDVGTTEMGLKASQFENTNTNFDKVTFEIRKDGYQEVTPIQAEVVIVGNNDTKPYDGEEHTVTGYVVEAITIDGKETTLYTEKDFTFSGAAQAQRTIVGKTDMELKASQFENKNTNFDTVTFVVTDGYQEITPVHITIPVVGNTDTVTYDGKRHEVTGYTLTIPKEVSKFYDESYVTFTGNAKASGIAINTYPMGLKEEQFGNTNKNVIVDKFDVEDGWLKIIGRGDGELFVIKASTDSVTKNYSGLVYSGFGYNLEAEGQSKTNALTRLINTLFGREEEIDPEMAVEGDTINIDGAQFKVTGLHVDTAERNVGDYTIAIEGYDEMVIKDVEGNEVTDQFTKLQKSEGILTILPIDIVVTSGTSSKYYDGTPLTNHSVRTSIPWCPGDEVTYDVTGSQTQVGNSSNTFDIIAEEGVLKNYNVTKVEGTLTVRSIPTIPTPPDDPTTTPETPPAAPVNQEVLGARREENGQAVLGARRSKTADETNDIARLFAIIVAAIVAVGLILTTKKKEEEQD
jgi:uncharacterized repeat protein (TIGR02543 family)